MSIKEMVLDTLKGKPGTQLRAADVHSELPVEDLTVEQVSNALAALAAWGEITRVSRGLYAYEFKSEDSPKLVKLLKQESPFSAEEDKDDEEGRYFSQVGTALNDDLILTRDSDGKAYRATPL